MTDYSDLEYTARKLFARIGDPSDGDFHGTKAVYQDGFLDALRALRAGDTVCGLFVRYANTTEMSVKGTNDG